MGACAAGVFENHRPLAQRTETMPRGHAARLPGLVAEVLSAAGPGTIDLVAVTVGPGSFTGLRAAISLAHGLAAGWACPVVGVGIVEAISHDVAGAEPDATVWIALHSRPGRIFLAQAGTITSVALNALPPVTCIPILAGNAAVAVAEQLRQRGDQVDLRTAETPSLAAVAAIALERHRGTLSPLPAQPLYVDAPEARLPPPP